MTLYLFKKIIDFSATKTESTHASLKVKVRFSRDPLEALRRIVNLVLHVEPLTLRFR